MKKLDIVKKPLFEILEREFSVPAFQRSYIWKKETIYELLDDLSDYKKSKIGKNNEYYLGILVFNNESDFLSIIDGQQRITTTFLILSYILANIKKTLADEKASDDLFEKLDNVYSKVHKLLFVERRVIKNSDKKSDVLKLKINYEKNNTKIKQLIDSKNFDLDHDDTLFDKISEFRKNKDKDNEYATAMICIDDWFRSKKLSIEEICEFSDLILGDVVVTRIQIEDKKDSHILYEVINARGQELSLMELIKNLLYSISYSLDEHYDEKVDYLMQKIDHYDELNLFDEDWQFEFIRSILILSNHKKNNAKNAKDIYREFKKEFSTAFKDGGEDSRKAFEKLLKELIDFLDFNTVVVDLINNAMLMNVENYNEVFNDLAFISGLSVDSIGKDSKKNKEKQQNDKQTFSFLFFARSIVLYKIFKAYNVLENLDYKDKHNKTGATLGIGVNKNFNKAVSIYANWLAKNELYYNSKGLTDFVAKFLEETDSKDITYETLVSYWKDEKNIAEYTKMPNDNEFSKALLEISSVKNKKTIKFLLSKINNYMEDPKTKKIIEVTNKYPLSSLYNEKENIEHVLPQKLDKKSNLVQRNDWKNEVKILDDEEFEKFHEKNWDRLGNLSLLYLIPNVKASNDSYSKFKKAIYKNATNTNLYKYFDSIDIWDQKAIDDRDKKLIDLLIEITKLK